MKNDIHVTEALKQNYTLSFSWSNAAATININSLNGEMFRDLRLATTENKRATSGANTTECLVSKVQWQQIRDVARRHSLRKSLAFCMQTVMTHCLMHNETVPVTASEALFLDDKTAETRPINQGVSKPRSPGQCLVAADTFVNYIMNHENYTILFADTHAAYCDLFFTPATHKQAQNGCGLPPRPPPHPKKRCPCCKPSCTAGLNS
jgi:hypothetical protein